jgi:hypothetical protein
MNISIRSGEENGLEFLLDSETWDNADPDAELDGFNVLVKDKYDASLVRQLSLLILIH